MPNSASSLTRVQADSAVIAVDGPSGSGKSSVSRGVATAFGLRYLDTGSLYRAATWWVLHNGADPTDADRVTAVVETAQIEAGTDPAAPTISVNGRNVATEIRSPEVTAAVSQVSAVPQVRSRLLTLQRELIGSGGVVVEGRDIGTVVAPDAEVKIFLTADPEVRGQRRHLESAHHDDATATAQALRARDAIDSNREVSPLRAATDAIEVDATHLNLDQVIMRVSGIVSERLNDD
jgi:cytidylate kinase